MAARQCPFCGKSVSAHLKQCTHCREALPPAPRIQTEAPSVSTGGSQIRRGLLFMLLAAVIGYFAGGYSWLKLPIPVIVPVVTKYLSPLLFLSGLGLAIHGYYLQHKSALNQH
jgi:hypothetical protein